MKDFQTIQRELTDMPFHPSLVEFKPGAGNGNDKIALAFITWTEYAKRLDEVCPGQWSMPTLPTVTSNGGELVTVSLAIAIADTTGVRTFPGVSDPKPGSQAFDQAFKRACALFGLGRYLYDMPNDIWLPYDDKKKQFDRSMFLATAIKCYERLGLMHFFPDVEAPPEDERRPARPTGQTRTTSRETPATTSSQGAGRSNGNFAKPTEKMVKSIIWRAETAGITDTSWAHNLTGAQAKEILDRNQKGEDMNDILDDILGVTSDSSGGW
jgi:hypothetical protein